jgi:hypothetical protein
MAHDRLSPEIEAEARGLANEVLAFGLRVLGHLMAHPTPPRPFSSTEQPSSSQTVGIAFSKAAPSVNEPSSAVSWHHLIAKDWRVFGDFLGRGGDPVGDAAITAVGKLRRATTAAVAEQMARDCALPDWRRDPDGKDGMTALKAKCASHLPRLKKAGRLAGKSVSTGRGRQMVMEWWLPNNHHTVEAIRAWHADGGGHRHVDGTVPDAPSHTREKDPVSRPRGI